MEKSQERIEILEKIKQFEREGRWHEDVENDPPAPELKPDQIDYLNKKLSSKIKNFWANRLAVKFFEKQIKQKQLIIKEIKGIENFTAVKGGAIVTSNHFNPMEAYAIRKTLMPYLKRKRLWTVIREGNYTNFPGLFGFVFKNCNTLPLSSNAQTMKNFMKAVKELLKKGEKILVYPEQAMWWNYRKPRPFQNGAFRFAVTNKVPIIPMFITMEDTDILSPDGFPVQSYIVNIMPAIYPNKELNKRYNIEYMKTANYDLCKKTYEDFYGIPLVYETIDNKK